MLTRVRPDLPLALGLLDERLPCVVFAVIIIEGNRGLFSPHQFLCFTASLRSSDSCFALGFPSTFPSSFVRFHRRRRRSAMGKPKKSSSAVGTSAAGGKKGAATTRVTDGGWRRSETRESDLRKLRERSLIPQDREAVKLLGNEVIPRPPAGYRVMFLAFVMRGFSFPVHNFLRGLLFLYGIQLRHLSPNSLLHIACFITFCECWLGIEPHFGLFRNFIS